MTVLTGAMLIGGSEVRGGKGEIRAVDPHTGPAWAAFAGYRDTALADDNPLGLWRRVAGRLER